MRADFVRLSDFCDHSNPCKISLWRANTQGDLLFAEVRRSFIFANSCIPYIEQRKLMAFWTSHISFLFQSNACKRCQRYPAIFELVITFWAFQFAFHMWNKKKSVIIWIFCFPISKKESQPIHHQNKFWGIPCLTTQHHTASFLTLQQIVLVCNILRMVENRHHKRLSSIRTF